MNGAELFVAALENEGVDRIFGLPGEENLDLLEAMRQDEAGALRSLRIDGGMSANAWFCQFLADLLEVPVERPAVLETTALGAAFLAGLATGVWPDQAALTATLAPGTRFTPRMAAAQRAGLVAGWHDALRRALPGRTEAPGRPAPG